MEKVIASGLSAREWQVDDLPLIDRYWTENDPAHMLHMGVDLEKLPAKGEIAEMLKGQMALPMDKRRSYATIWTLEGNAIGHCNLGPFEYGKTGFMHLHLWDPSIRQKGMGTQLIRLSLPFFFENAKLQTLYSQPYALNPAPHRALEKAGFQFVKNYVTIPGSLNFEQEVRLWKMEREDYHQLVNSS